MIKKIRIENFMSHRDTVLEPAEGVTLLSGPNNCGKSAVLMAMCGISGYSDGRGDYMIRHGETTAKVTLDVENDDGNHVIEWLRGKSTAGWTIDSKVSSRGVSDNLQEILKLPLLPNSEGEGKYLLHFADQKDPLFILSQAGSQKASFFAASSDAGYLLKMQNLHKSNVRDRNKEKTRLDGEIADLKKKLEETSAVITLDTDLAKLESDFSGIADTDARIRSLEGLAGQIQKGVLQLGNAEQANAALENLAAPPALEDTGTLADLLEGYLDNLSEKAFQSQVLTGLYRLKEPPMLEDADGLDSLIGRLRSAEATHFSETRRAGQLSALAPPPDVYDTGKLEAAIINIEKAREKVTGHETHSQVLTSLPICPAIESTIEIDRAIGLLNGLQTDLIGKQGILQEISEDLAASVVAIASWSGSHPVCPTCGSHLEPGTLMKHIGGTSHE